MAITNVKEQNFFIVSDPLKYTVMDVEVANENLVNPEHADCLIDGEWVKLDSNGKAVRITHLDDTYPIMTQAPGAAMTTVNVVMKNADKCFPVLTLKKATDKQMTKKIQIIKLGTFEADTYRWDSAATYNIGDEVVVGLVDGKVAILPKADISSAHDAWKPMYQNIEKVIGIVTKLPADNDQKLRVLVTL